MMHSRKYKILELYEPVATAVREHLGHAWFDAPTSPQRSVWHRWFAQMAADTLHTRDVAYETIRMTGHPVKQFQEQSGKVEHEAVQS